MKPIPPHTCVRTALIISTLMILGIALTTSGRDGSTSSTPSTSSNCALCHENVIGVWSNSTHAGVEVDCLNCHYKSEGGPPHPTTDYNTTTCNSCHVNYQFAGSKMAESGVDCWSCHSPHSLSPYSLQLSVECGRCHTQLQQANVLDPYCRSCHMLGGSSREGGNFSSWKSFRHDFSASLNETCLRCHSTVPVMDMALLQLQKEVLLLKVETALSRARLAVEAANRSGNVEGGMRAGEYLAHAEQLLSVVSKEEETDRHQWLIDHTLLTASIKLAEKAEAEIGPSPPPPDPLQSGLPLIATLAVGVSLAVVISYSLRTFEAGRVKK